MLHLNSIPTDRYHIGLWTKAGLEMTSNLMGDTQPEGNVKHHGPPVWQAIAYLCSRRIRQLEFRS